MHDLAAGDEEESSFLWISGNSIENFSGVLWIELPNTGLLEF